MYVRLILVASVSSIVSTCLKFRLICGRSIWTRRTTWIAGLIVRAYVNHLSSFAHRLPYRRDARIHRILLSGIDINELATNVLGIGLDALHVLTDHQGRSVRSERIGANVVVVGANVTGDTHALAVFARVWRRLFSACVSPEGVTRRRAGG